MCRSEAPINRPSTMIRAGCDNVPSQRHIGRSLRLNSVKHHFAAELGKGPFYCITASSLDRIFSAKKKNGSVIREAMMI